MKEKLEKLAGILISYKASSTVLISNNLAIPEVFNRQGFEFISKEITGVVFFSSGHPLSNMDIDIDNIFEFDDLSTKYKNKAHSIVVQGVMINSPYLVRKGDSLRILK